MILTLSKNCILTDLTTHAAVPVRGDNHTRPAINAPTSVSFCITNTKLYVLDITLSTDNDNKLLQQLKTEFKRTIKWNKYRSEISNQPKNNNLSYLIDPTFNKVNRLFILLFENENGRFCLFQDITHQL